MAALLTYVAAIYSLDAGADLFPEAVCKRRDARRGFVAREALEAVHVIESSRQADRFACPPRHLAHEIIERFNRDAAEGDALRPQDQQLSPNFLPWIRQAGDHNAPRLDGTPPCRYASRQSPMPPRVTQIP